MDGVRLYRLGKRLIDLSREVTTHTGDTSLTQAEVAVLEDALRHPDGSVSEIQARTGFAQSHVSASVARLKERGLLDTVTDPADRRRTRVRLSAPATRAILRRASAPADPAVARVLADPDRTRRALALLDELAELLLEQRD